MDTGDKENEFQSALDGGQPQPPAALGAPKPSAVVNESKPSAIEERESALEMDAELADRPPLFSEPVTAPLSAFDPHPTDMFEEEIRHGLDAALEAQDEILEEMAQWERMEPLAMPWFHPNEDMDEDDSLEKKMEAWRNGPRPTHPVVPLAPPAMDVDSDEEWLAMGGQRKRQSMFADPGSDAESNHVLASKRSRLNEGTAAKTVVNTAVAAVRKDYTVAPATGIYKRAVSFDGKPLFFPFHRFKLLDEKLKNMERNAYGGKRISLLTKSVFKLMDEIESERIDCALVNSKELLQERMAGVKHDDSKFQETQLWAEKYRPKSYIDLLSEEWINREIMRWLKQWDQCVFKKAPVPVAEAEENPFKIKDRYGRPDKKILLLHGPPGLGKTTLAHVVAKQFGYNIIEINASDERNADTVRTKITNSIESNTVTGGGRPNLIIIDEIDGVSGGQGENNFIKVLLDIVDVPAHGKDRNDGNEPEGPSDGISQRDRKRKGKKNKGGRQPLLRPIICVCNDLYTPALRPLRNVAQLYSIRKPTISTLSKRLKQICDNEGLRADMRALAILCEKTDGDVRTCLNTLQFLHQKLRRDAERNQMKVGSTPNWKATKKFAVTQELVKTTPIGQKDAQRSIFTAWNEIFQVPSAAKLDTLKLNSREENVSEIKDWGAKFISHVLPTIEMNGEYDRIMNGCFEFYPQMKMRDNRGYGSAICALHEYIHLYDRSMASMYGGSRGGGGHGEAIAYVPFALLAFHHFCANLGQLPKFEYPRQETDARYQMRQNDYILSSLVHHLDVRSRIVVGSKETFTLQFLSPFLRILAPKFRSMNAQLLKGNERMALTKLAHVMCSFRINYVQEKTESGQYAYRLDPPLEELVQFSLLNNVKNILPVIYNARQMIAHEVDVVTMRLEEEALARRFQAQVTLDGKKKGVQRDKDLTNLMNASRVKLKTDVIVKDFFGREIAQEILDAQEAAAKLKREERKIVYKFHEGYSNAVRRTVLMSDLIKPLLAKLP